MSRKRVASAAVGVLLLAGATAVPILGTGGSAYAGGATHKVKLFTNYSSIVENAAKVKFSCSSNTGDFTLSISNINVVDSTGKSFISSDLTPSDALYFQVGGEQDQYAPMTQNTTTGLWQVSITGTIYTGFCYSGSLVQVLDSLTEGGDFNVGGNMS